MAGATRSSKHSSGRWSPIERDLRAAHGVLLAGVDEVGRGPLAGPVVACAIIMPPDMRAIPGVDDSKRLTADKRVVLAGRIRARALHMGLGASSPREIDRINIYHATTRAIRRAIRALGVAPDHVLIDGKPIKTLELQHTAVVGGDGRCYSVACASIIAKVVRDRLLATLAVRYPRYAWEHNMGYATQRHLDAIDLHGVTPHHRKSFCVKQLMFDFALPAVES